MAGRYDPDRIVLVLDCKGPLCVCIDGKTRTDERQYSNILKGTELLQVGGPSCQDKLMGPPEVEVKVKVKEMALLSDVRAR